MSVKWFGPVQLTSPARTLRDYTNASVSPELLREAAQQALHRGLIVKDDLREVEGALEVFGGLAA
jgi:hypothetical protein